MQTKRIVILLEEIMNLDVHIVSHNDDAIPRLFNKRRSIEKVQNDKIKNLNRVNAVMKRAI